MNIKMLFTFPLTLAATCATAQTFHYPKAPQNNTIDTYFGTQIADPYRPLEDDNSIETQRWVTAENELTRHYLDRLPMRPKLLKRLKEVANYEKIGTPFKRNNTWYVYKNNGLQNQSVLYKMDKLGGTLYEVLDPNKLSTDGTVALKGISFSHNGRYLAYVIARNGSDWQEIYVKDLTTGNGLILEMQPGVEMVSIIVPMMHHQITPSPARMKCIKYTIITLERHRKKTAFSIKTQPIRFAFTP